jgi:hypothetical protein
VQEVQVLSSQFTPEYGEALASVTSAVTKSGTNERHGSALLFAQAGVLNDQPVFAAAKPGGGSARYGFTIGGPIAAIARSISRATKGATRGRATSWSRPSRRRPKSPTTRTSTWRS